MLTIVNAASSFLVVVLFLWSPRSAYLNSGEADFPFPLLSYLWPLMLMGLGVVFIVSLIHLLLPRKGRAWFAVLIVFLSLMVGAETFILMPDFGAFTGRSVDLSASWVRYIFESITIVLTLSLAWQWTRAPAFPSILLGSLAVVLSISSLWSAVSEAKSGPDPADDATVFSRDEKNLLIVLLDGFPSDVFEEIVDADSGWRSRLEGFTYFPDTVGVSPTTFLALPSIHSGEVYSPGTPLQPFFTSSVGDHSFLSDLSTAGYTSLLVNPMNGVCPKNTQCVPAGIVLGDYVRLQKTGMARLFGLSLFSAAPLGLKKAVYDDGRWVFPPLVADERITDHNVEGVETLKFFSANLAAERSVPTAKFIHILTPHLPVVIGDGCKYSGHTIPATREAFLTQAKCALGAFEDLVTSLRKNGLYDNTAIVLLSDHGQAIPSRKANADGDWKKLSGWANPLLAVKPLGAAGPMEVSSAPKWLAEIPSIICEMMEDCETSAAGSQKARIFNYYEWKNEYWGADEIPVDRFTVSGPPWDARSWKAQ
ncbi:sulfatase-like hydrolase/transferase [Rhizobium daejeonense]|uniref:Sulfatase-like hydrolase/transferase n=1 Tax=Rhizobium daejeonense TaxID=240521 RepID=A0A6M1RVI1_9HYPH|nr:sulfatase-like hydrolase/transferase [Rhizobium daejeonense]NGO63129.1 sulfatase-like hydrolase/transferase [Rhizobium daejeonense]